MSVSVGTVVPLSREERKRLKACSKRGGNSGMGHTCKCLKRPLEAWVYVLTPGGVRRVMMCEPCADRVKRRWA